MLLDYSAANPSRIEEHIEKLKEIIHQRIKVSAKVIFDKRVLWIETEIPQQSWDDFCHMKIMVECYLRDKQGTLSDYFTFVDLTKAVAIQIIYDNHIEIMDSVKKYK